MYREKGNHIVTTAIEQRASLDVCKRLERQGLRGDLRAGATRRPRSTSTRSASALTDKTILISVMFANNEIGTIQDMAAIGKLAKEKGIIFHADATQAVGKIPVNVEAMGIDLLSCTAHLIYGPKGVGALYVRRKAPRVRIAPLIDGGGHERGHALGHAAGAAHRRASGAAAEICGEVMAEESARLAELRDRLQDMILSNVDEAYPERPPGAAAAAQPEHLVRVRRGRVGADGAQQGERRCRSGSACTSSTLEPSYVIAALGRERRAGPLVDPLQPAPVQHRGGSRVRRRSGRSRSSSGCGRCRRSTSWPRKAWI